MFSGSRYNCTINTWSTGCAPLSLYIMSEKEEHLQLENIKDGGGGNIPLEEYHIDKKAEKRLLFKLDIAILPMTVLMVSLRL